MRSLPHVTEINTLRAFLFHFVCSRPCVCVCVCHGLFYPFRLLRHAKELMRSECVCVRVFLSVCTSRSVKLHHGKR